MKYFETFPFTVSYALYICTQLELQESICYAPISEGFLQMKIDLLTGGGITLQAAVEARDFTALVQGAVRMVLAQIAD